MDEVLIIPKGEVTKIFERLRGEPGFSSDWQGPAFYWKKKGSITVWGREWVREKAIGSSVVQLTVRLLTVMGAKFRKQFSAGNKMNLDRLIGKCVWDFLSEISSKELKSSLTLLWPVEWMVFLMSPRTPISRKGHDLARWPWVRDVRWNSDEGLLVISEHNGIQCPSSPTNL